MILTVIQKINDTMFLNDFLALSLPWNDNATTHTLMKWWASSLSVLPQNLKLSASAGSLLCKKGPFDTNVKDGWGE